MQWQPLHMLSKLSKRNSNGLLFNEDTHLIGTLTGDGSDSTNQQTQHKQQRRASPSSNRYPFWGHSKTPMLCTNYNVGLKTRREAKIRPLKKKSRSTNTLPTTSQNFVLKRAELKSTQTLKDFMYTDLYPTLRNINKHARASWFVNTSEAQKTNLEDSCKSHHNTKRRAYHSLGFLHGQSGAGTRSGRNTQSRTKGSYIYDVESCHIQTLTIHL